MAVVARPFCLASRGRFGADAASQLRRLRYLQPQKMPLGWSGFALALLGSPHRVMLAWVIGALLFATLAAWRRPGEVLAAVITLASGCAIYAILARCRCQLPAVGRFARARQRRRGREVCRMTCRLMKLPSPLRLGLTFFMGLFTLSSESAADAANDYAAARQRMVREIEAEVRTTRKQLGKETLDPRVIAAIGKVPRHEFVPQELRHLAYANQPLPIGYEQTISQPYIVAIMTDLLGLPHAGRVLEVGTGSGYQAAVLAEMGVEVYTIEIVEPLGLRARATLKRLGYGNVHVRIGDGFAGWPEAAPFDAIIVTAAAAQTPPPLLAQLRPGGRMIIPLEAGFAAQDLVLIEKDVTGAISRREVLPVLFVPLTGEH